MRKLHLVISIISMLTVCSVAAHAQSGGGVGDHNSHFRASD